MKKVTLLLVAFSLASLGCSSVEPSAKKDASIDAKVRQLLAKMTVEEKVGQMTQITLEPFAKSGKDGIFAGNEKEDEHRREGQAEGDGHRHGDEELGLEAGFQHHGR